ncbi:MAG TPA: hypothetical protein VFG23_01655 [Polyangia bacterium]|nr:hypothetical protein [Polyangia bacterium]
MNGESADSRLCARAFERLIETGEVGSDPILGEHLGSCVTCFRTLTELRDVPRLAGLLRETAPAAPAADDRFWEALAARTMAAVAAAQTVTTPLPVRPSAPARRSEALGRLRATFLRGRVAIAATAVVAAAALVVMRRPPAGLATPTQPAAASGAVVAATRSTSDDGAGEVAADVADLDGTALRRLLDRLRTRAPAVLTSFPTTGDATDPSDGLGDDDRRVNDEVADLDGTALRRVASSLEASPL